MKNNILDYQKKLNEIIEFLKENFHIGSEIRNIVSNDKNIWAVNWIHGIQFFHLTDKFPEVAFVEMREFFEKMSDEGFLRKEPHGSSKRRSLYFLTYKLFQNGIIGEYIFYAREFHRETKDIYLEIKNMFKKYIDIELVMLEETLKAGNINNVIYEKIKNCKFVIADISSYKNLSNINNNVVYEIGLAHAFSKKVLIIFSKKMKFFNSNSRVELPFDISSHSAMEYDDDWSGESEEDYGDFLKSFKQWVISTLNEEQTKIK